MKTSRINFPPIRGKALAVAVAAIFAPHTFAAPAGGTFVVGGGDGASIVHGPHTVVTAKPSALTSVINWSSFNVGSGESVTYRYHGNDWHSFINVDQQGAASRIQGAIRSPGAADIYIVNPNGVHLDGAKIDVVGTFTAIAGEMSALPTEDGYGWGVTFVPSPAAVTISNQTEVKAEYVQITGSAVEILDGAKIEASGTYIDGDAVRIEGADASSEVVFTTGQLSVEGDTVSLKNMRLEGWETVTRLTAKGDLKISGSTMVGGSFDVSAGGKLSIKETQIGLGLFRVESHFSGHQLEMDQADFAGLGVLKVGYGPSASIKGATFSVLDFTLSPNIYRQGELGIESTSIVAEDRALIESATMRMADTSVKGWKVEALATDGDIILSGDVEIDAERVATLASYGTGGSIDAAAASSLKVSAEDTIVISAGDGSVTLDNAEIEAGEGFSYLGADSGSIVIKGVDVTLGSNTRITSQKYPERIYLQGVNVVYEKDPATGEMVIRQAGRSNVTSSLNIVDEDTADIRGAPVTHEYLAEGSETSIEIRARGTLTLKPGVVLEAGDPDAPGAGVKPNIIRFAVGLDNNESTYGETPEVEYRFWYEYEVETEWGFSTEVRDLTKEEVASITGIDIESFLQERVKFEEELDHYTPVGSYEINVRGADGGGFATLRVADLAGTDLDATVDGIEFVFQSEGADTWNVTPRYLTIEAESGRKIYGQPMPTIGWSITEGTLVNNDTLDVSMALSSPTYTDTRIEPKVGLYDIVYADHKVVHGGPRTYHANRLRQNYEINFIGGSFEVNPAELSIAGLEALSRVYDGTSSARIAGTPVLSGVVAGDDVRLEGDIEGFFDDKNVGIGKEVWVTGLTLVGDSADNYYLGAVGDLYADITPASLSLTGIIAIDRVYDATRDATIVGTPTLQGVIGSDDVSLIGGTTGLFDNKDAGANKPVSVDVSLTGEDAGNYTLQDSELFAAIEKAPLYIRSIDDAREANGSPYHGGNGVVYAGLVPGEDATVLEGSLVYVGTSQGATAAGEYTIIPSGVSAKNYDITPVAGKLTLSAAVTTPPVEPPPVEPPPVEPPPVEPPPVEPPPVEPPPVEPPPVEPPPVEPPPVEPPPVEPPPVEPPPVVIPPQSSTPILLIQNTVVKQDTTIEVPQIRANEILVPAQGAGQVEVSLQDGADAAGQAASRQESPADSTAEEGQCSSGAESSC